MRKYITLKRNIPRSEVTIEELRTSELKSNRYRNILRFVNSNYWKMNNPELVKELFDIINDFEFNDFFTNVTDKRVDTLNKLRDFLSNLTEEQKESNIFLRRACDYLECAKIDCMELFKSFAYDSDIKLLHKVEMPYPKEIYLLQLNEICSIYPDIIKNSYIHFYKVDDELALDGYFIRTSNEEIDLTKLDEYFNESDKQRKR